MSDYSLALLTFCRLLENRSQFSDSLIHTIHRCWIFGWCHPNKRSPWARGACHLGGVLHLSGGIWRAVLWDVPLRLQKRNSESRAIQSMRALYLQWTQWDLWPWDRWDDDLWWLQDLNPLQRMGRKVLLVLFAYSLASSLIPTLPIGVCDCRDNTAGPHCEKCSDGYYGDSTTGSSSDCQPCPCSGGSSCAVVPKTQEVVCTNCPTGTTGKSILPICSQCSILQK